MWIDSVKRADRVTRLKNHTHTFIQTYIPICVLDFTKVLGSFSVNHSQISISWFFYFPLKLFETNINHLFMEWREFSFPQKARLARIRIAKASSGAAFVSKKKAAEARLAAQESGLQLDENYKEEDIFELQHHHLLRCLEKTTVSKIIFKSV